MTDMVAAGAPPSHGSSRVTHWVTWAEDLFRVSERGLMPLLDLFIRLWLAQAFWVSGWYKITNWETAKVLAATEYPVPGLDPLTWAWLNTGIELVGPILLALGLGTRFGALLLLLVALAYELFYVQVVAQEFQAILCGWYLVMGAGPIALDRAIGRGFGETALPFARTLSAIGQTLRRYGEPVYMLAFRIWIAWSFLMIGLHGAGQMSDLLMLAQHIFPVLLAIGLATRLSCLPLIALTVAIQMSTAQQPDHIYFTLVLALILLRGPGPLSADHAISRYIRSRFPLIDDLPASEWSRLPHVVIVGAGFGGTVLARKLVHAPCRVTLIDRRNYHLFQPLLYQVATAALSPADIAVPIRTMFREQPNVRVLLGRVTGVDTERREVLMGDSRVPYDTLVLATGARHSYFGKDHWEPYAPGLKKIDDATEIRRRILLAFEQAENSTDPQEQRDLMTFAVVGGGPTGVELAGAIAELARHGMAREFRNIDPVQARVLLVQAAPRLLPPFPESLSARTKTSLERLGVEVMLDSMVEEVDELGITVKGERIGARTVFWAAGVAASPAAKWIDGESDRSGRLKVGPDLSVPGHPEIFAIGDTALSEAWDGKPVPGLAPAAKQQGGHVARVLKARLEGRRPPAPYRYVHMGNLATIGRAAAVVDFGWLRLSGALAWWLWGLVHVYFLVGARNRIAVALEWFWAYLTFKRSTRLITGEGS